MNVLFHEILNRLEIPLELGLFFLFETCPYMTILPKYLSATQYRNFICYISEIDYDVEDIYFLLDIDMYEEELEDLIDYCCYIRSKFKGKRNDLRLLFS